MAVPRAEFDGKSAASFYRHSHVVQNANTEMRPGSVFFLRATAPITTAANFFGRFSIHPEPHGERVHRPVPLGGKWVAEQHIPILRHEPAVPQFHR